MMRLLPGNGQTWVAYVDGAEGVFGSASLVTLSMVILLAILFMASGDGLLLCCWRSWSGLDLWWSWHDHVYGGAGEDILIDIEGGDNDLG